MLKKVSQPNNIETRDTLFGDLPLDHWAKADSNEIPWTLFKEVKKNVDKKNKAAAIKILKDILNIAGLETRQYLQAFYFLNQLQALPEGTVKILGAVVEVTMEDGVDLLAVYADHTARYYNYTGSAVIWDLPDTSIAGKIDHILSLAKDIVAQIGPWQGERPGIPKPGNARINFLTSHGLHFGEAGQNVLFNDPMAGKIMYAMLDMMETLTQRVMQSKKAS
ncbi:hypothetical protein [Ferruginibacter sp.]